MMEPGCLISEDFINTICYVIVLYCVKQEAVPTVTAEELEELLNDF